ncbi:MAG TPA: rRNA maturation RNase YbeY [Rhizomicrobium sp.]|nr:rRNA maturation RNase YbeY [Rhizomicrobium sp.]
MTFAIHFEIDDPRWKRRRGVKTRLEQAARLALRGKARRGGLTILLTSDARLKTLNHDFRGKNKPTNVLSFPAAPNDEAYLGDVALAFGVTEAEALKAGKRFADHAVHLVIHGVLHLLGFDHVTNAQAKKMEPLETRLLARLGIDDPYAEAA